MEVLRSDPRSTTHMDSENLSTARARSLKHRTVTGTKEPTAYWVEQFTRTADLSVHAPQMVILYSDIIIIQTLRILVVCDSVACIIFVHSRLPQGMLLLWNLVIYHPSKKWIVLLRPRRRLISSRSSLVN